MDDEYAHHTQAEIKADQRGEFAPAKEWLDENPDVALDAILVGEKYMRGRLSNDVNQAQAYRNMNWHIETNYDLAKREWESNNDV